MTSMYRGHPIVWVYADTRQAVADDPLRPCGHCGLPCTEAGHDGCLGELPGVVNACCGHGVVDEAYVVLACGHRLSGNCALAAMCRLAARAVERG